MTPQIALAGMILTAIGGLPGQFVAAYNINPGPWNFIGLALLAFVALSMLSRRVGRRRAR
jgi:ABC-type phosphate/phosphonate transport system permease subunit